MKAILLLVLLTVAPLTVRADAQRSFAKWCAKYNCMIIMAFDKPGLKGSAAIFAGDYADGVGDAPYNRFWDRMWFTVRRNKILWWDAYAR